MLAQTFTGDFSIPKTGDPTIDALVAKIMVIMTVIGGLLTLMSALWARLQGFKTAIMSIATSIQTATNGDLEALLRKYAPSLTDAQIKLIAKAAHDMITSKIKASNEDAKVEHLVQPLVAKAKEAIEEVKRSKAQITVPQDPQPGSSGRSFSFLLLVIALASIVALSVGCAATSIPQAHLDADTAFLDAVEPDYFYLLAANGELYGETVTADVVDLKKGAFHSFRTALEKARQMREAGNK